MGIAERIGQQLGNYRLVRQIGKGGFAEVYLGEYVYHHLQCYGQPPKTRLGEVAHVVLTSLL